MKLELKVTRLVSLVIEEPLPQLKSAPFALPVLMMMMWPKGTCSSLARISVVRGSLYKVFISGISAHVSPKLVV